MIFTQERKVGAQKAKKLAFLLTPGWRKAKNLAVMKLHHLLQKDTL
jgi:hypothetical protein